MPVTRDYLENAVRCLHKAASLCTAIYPDIVVATNIKAQIEEVLLDADDNIREYYQQIGLNNQSIERAQQVIFPLNPHKQPFPLIADRCYTAVRYLYEAVGELEPISDPNQIEIQF